MVVRLTTTVALAGIQAQTAAAAASAAAAAASASTVATALEPAALTTALAAWFATLPTAAPTTPGQPWKSGNTLAFS